MLTRYLSRSLQYSGLRLASTASGQKFDGKVAVVTGCTEGIGLGVAKRLGQDGASIVVNSRKQENVDRTLQELQDQGVKVTGVTCDVAKAEDRSKLFKHTLDTFGRLDMFVPNAGISPYYGPFFKTKEKVWDKIMDINVKATFFLCKEALPELAKTKGSIVLMSSVMGMHTYETFGAYSISKSAVLAMVKAMSPECAEVGVRVNCVAPGLIETPLTEALKYGPPGERAMTSSSIKRMGRPEEVAEVVKFLLSDEASYVTGETIAIAGGHFSRL